MNRCNKIVFLISVFFLLSCQSSNKINPPIREYFVPQGIDIMLSFNPSYEGDDPIIVSFNSIIKRKLSGQVITMSGDVIVGILSFREGAVWGEELSTYADGSLKKYAFRHNAHDAVFYRKYDSLHHVIGEQGTPCVGHFAHEYSNGDSLRSDVLFVDGIFEDMKIELSTDGVSFKEIDAYDNAEYKPYKLYRHLSSLRDQHDAKLYFRMTCIDSITKEKLLFKDSVSLSAYKK
ncbi:hypothetical protein [Chitinophaga tropicalis]|uniref:Uncharacterized protein n=1 Tax=Chitinophaga tropicalis TaxID=2683588 RepID=A0A7K1UDY6_9BACT|nr:hypothetical protein [Chitinophaga tropicalis]MVT12592.1 hypothetical protein [Chitinophaga tropicalis]